MASTRSSPRSRAGRSTTTPRSQIPNYWAYARNFALFDHFFSTLAGPSSPGHFAVITAPDSALRQLRLQRRQRRLRPRLRDAGSGAVRAGLQPRRPARTSTAAPCFKVPTVIDHLPDGLHLAHVRERQRPEQSRHGVQPRRQRRQPRRRARGALPHVHAADRRISRAAIRRTSRTSTCRARRTARSEHPPNGAVHRRELHGQHHQRDHARSALERDRDHPHVGRLRRLLRSREAAGREAARTARSSTSASGCPRS